MYKLIRIIAIVLGFALTSLIFAQQGSLNVQITGLPSEVDARVLIYRGGEFITQLEASRIVPLPAGEYIVGAIPTEVGEFAPRPPESQRIQLLANQSQSVVINYSPNGPPPPSNGDLVICEVGHTSSATLGGSSLPSAWLEVFNPTNQSINLSSYQLRSLDRVWEEQIFSLPNVLVHPNSYILIRGRFDDILVDGPNLLFVDNGNRSGSTEKIYPQWNTSTTHFSGFVELVKGNQSVDYIKWGEEGSFLIKTPFGNSAQEAWSGGGIPFDRSQGIIGGSFSRNQSCSDTNQASDWHIQKFATPGGPNDVPQDAVDKDFDGIPDSAECNELDESSECVGPSGTFAGIDLIAMGASTKHRDIFVEVDVMKVENHIRLVDNVGFVNLGVLLREEALDKVVKAFADGKSMSNGQTLLPIKVHFDVGNFFESGKYNLGQGDPRVDFAPSVKLAPTASWLISDPELRLKQNFYYYKHNFMDPARLAIFHYMLMAPTENNNGLSGRSGSAELFGNDILITLGGEPFPEGGGHFFDDKLCEENDPNKYRCLQRLINTQAGVIMHELGHNLGLQHGGLDEINDKPNYLSVMNYLYLLYGIGPKTGDKVHERVYMIENIGPEDKNRDQCNMVDSICSRSYKIDFSYGRGEVLNEERIFEREGIGHGNANIDWDGDGDSTGVLENFNVNNDYQINEQNQYILDPDGNKIKKIDILRNYNDWDNLKLSFRLSDNAVFSPPLSDELEEVPVPLSELEEAQNKANFLLNDIQPIVIEEPIFFFIPR